MLPRFGVGVLVAGLLLCGEFAPGHAAKGQGLPSIRDDTTTTTVESEWFAPEQHLEELKSWTRSRMAATGAFDALDCLDLFGATQRVGRCWRKYGYSSLSYDIKLGGPNHDITSEGGFRALLDMGARLDRRGIVIAAPPCSLYGPCCASVHRRSHANVRGNMDNFKVRLAWRIWTSFAVFLEILHGVRENLYCFIEQPSGSWAFRQPEMVHIASLLGLTLTTTWMCYYSHDMLKSTHIMSNVRQMASLKRVLHPKDRVRFQSRFARRQARRKRPRVYHKRVTSRSGKQGWQGGPDLPLSAAFTRVFCKALINVWLEALIAAKRAEYSNDHTV